MTEQKTPEPIVEEIIELVTDYNAVVAALIVGLAIGAVAAYVALRYVSIERDGSALPPGFADMAHPAE